MITKLIFKERGKIYVHLDDGRIIILPLNNFPSLKKLTPRQRKYYAIVQMPDKTQRAIIFNRNIILDSNNFLNGKELIQ